MQAKSYQLSEIMTEKEFLKIQLFQRTRQIKGQFIFKFLYQRSKFIHIKQKTELPQLQEKKYFVFILKGQILIYKTHTPSNKHNSLVDQAKNKFIANKSFIRTYQQNQFFGYQDYPLYWKQQLSIQAAADTQIIIFPIQFLYKVFNKVVPLVSIQNTAQYLKKMPIFRSVELQKLFRLSSFCKRIRTYMDTKIFAQEQKIQDIIILYDGRFAIYNQQGFYRELQSSSIIGSSQLQEGRTNYNYNGKSLAQCDFIMIPLKQYMKVVQIKNQLQKSGNMEQSQKKLKIKKISNFKLHTQSIDYSIPSKQEANTIEPKPGMTDFMKRVKGSSFAYSPSLQIYEHQSKQKIRPASAVSTYSKSHTRNITYCSNGRQLFVNKTQLNFYKDSDSGDIGPKNKRNQKAKSNIELQNVTLGELCLMKFINRKQRLQHRQMDKYIKSKAPQLILNPNKQFGVIKGLQGKNSPYIKNFKRKIKNSNRKGKLLIDGQIQSNEQANLQQSKRRFSKFKQFQIQSFD